MPAQEVKKISAKKAVGTSFVVSIFDVLLNLLAVFVTGSVVTLAEAFHGAGDLAVGGLLLIGLRRSAKPADKHHPLGHGRELYIWTMFAALLMLTVTAGASIYFGIERLLRPREIGSLYLAYGVLGFLVLSNAYSTYLSGQRIFGEKKESLFSQFKNSPLVESKITFILDLMGTLGPLFGLISLIFFGVTGDLIFDGVGAIGIGVSIAVLALFLVSTVRDLLVGRRVSPEKEEQIHDVALSIPEVQEILDSKVVIIGPQRLLVNLEIHFQEGLTTERIEQVIDRIKSQIQEQVPEAHHIQVEPETPDGELAGPEK